MSGHHSGGGDDDSFQQILSLQSPGTSVHQSVSQSVSRRGGSFPSLVITLSRENGYLYQSHLHMHINHCPCYTHSRKTRTLGQEQIQELNLHQPLAGNDIIHGMCSKLIFRTFHVKNGSSSSASSLTRSYHSIWP